MPGWQKLYEELKSKNFEIITIAQDTGGARDAAQWIKAANPTNPSLIDQKQQVTMLYNLVNVPTGIWINELGRIVRPPEVAYVDNRFTYMHHVEAAPYLAALRDWAENGDKSKYVLSEDEVRRRITPESPDRARAAVEFGLGEYLYHKGFGPDAIPHFKEAQRLNPHNWNYKRQAWALSDAEKDYGTSFMKEVLKLKDKPYYEPRVLEPAKGDKNESPPDKKN